MAVDMFLKIDGFDGESRHKGHEKEIDVLSFSWGLMQSATLHTGGGGTTGKASFQDFHFVTRPHKSSPKLMEACASGKHIAEAVLTVQRSGGDSIVEFYKLKFTDVLVSSFQDGGDAAADVSETMSLNFAKIEFQYTEQTNTGSKGATTTGSWNIQDSTTK